MLDGLNFATQVMKVVQVGGIILGGGDVLVELEIFEEVLEVELMFSNKIWQLLNVVQPLQLTCIAHLCAD